MQKTAHFLARRDVPDARVSIETAGRQIASIRTEMERPRQRRMHQMLQLRSSMRIPDVCRRACTTGDVTPIRAKGHRDNAVWMIQADILPSLGSLPGSYRAIRTDRQQLRPIWAELNLIN